MKPSPSSTPGRPSQPMPSGSAARKPWRKPQVLSSETFTKAALTCCLIDDGGAGQPNGSTGANLPPCT
jgi:hypothetical protein